MIKNICTIVFSTRSFANIKKKKIIFQPRNSIPEKRNGTKNRGVKLQ